MSNITVAKFGGSSLADAEQFKKVKDIVTKNKAIKYVVPSAPGKRNSNDYKITDLLYLCHEHVKQGISFNDVFKIIESRFIEIVNNLSSSCESMKDLNIVNYLKNIKENIAKGASRDYVASRGEYLNGIILSKYLGFQFVDAAEIVFFDKKGRYDRLTTKKAIAQKLKKMKNCVIPGFYGSMPDGSIKTFSRGGSDITGSIISSGVNAKLYQNWTDVSGFLMADPRIVKNPKLISKVTYRELRELSYMGATVLHEEAIFPVREASIPINIKNTNRPQDEGTLIIDDLKSTDQEGTITGIAGKKDFTVIAIEKTLLNSEIGFCRKLLGIIESYGISFEHMPSGIDTVSVVIADSELDGKLDDMLNDIQQQFHPDSLEVYPNMALIATVGMGMAKAKGVAAKIFMSLAKEGVNIRMIDQGSSEINIIVGVENTDFEKAVRAIYEAFV